MRKILNKPWVVAVLAIAAVALVAHTLLDQREPVPLPQSAGLADESFDETAGEDAGVASEALDPAQGGTLAEVLKSLVLPESIPDPFAPRVARGPATVDRAEPLVPDITETVHLTAIWEQAGISYVLLNNRICLPGDAIGRITVASIEREGVWLSHWKGRDFLQFGQDFTLITPGTAPANSRTANHEG